MLTTAALSRAQLPLRLAEDLLNNASHVDFAHLAAVRPPVEGLEGLTVAHEGAGIVVVADFDGSDAKFV